MGHVLLLKKNNNRAARRQQQRPFTRNNKTTTESTTTTKTTMIQKQWFRVVCAICAIVLIGLQFYKSNDFFRNNMELLFVAESSSSDNNDEDSNNSVAHGVADSNNNNIDDSSTTRRNNNHIIQQPQQLSLPTTMRKEEERQRQPIAQGRAVRRKKILLPSNHTKQQKLVAGGKLAAEKRLAAHNKLSVTGQNSDNTAAPLLPPNSSNNSLTTTTGVVWKVYQWTKGVMGGTRERLYNKEGWNAHPNTTIVDSPDEADIIAWVTTMGKVEDEVPPSNYSNVIVLDYADGCTVHPKRDELKHEIGYFKRSFVWREHGVFLDNCSTHEPKPVWPYAYSGIEALLPDTTKQQQQQQEHLPYAERPLDLVNLLRSEGYHNENRRKIVQWTKAYVESRSLANTSYIGAAGNGWSGSDWNRQFMTQMRQSKIVVTCNPAPWEGDFRLWEALLSGALVFVDKMAILDWMPHPLVNGTHFVVYDSRKRSKFYALLDYYRSHPLESERIADAGYRYVVQHHMPRNRIEYVLQNVQITPTKKTAPPPPPPPPSGSSLTGGVWKVYEWTKGVIGGTRKRLYNKEGWNTHPNTTIVDSPDDADIVVWVTTMGKVEDEIPPSNYSNVIVLDYADGWTTHPRRKDLKHEIGYFKRSFVRRQNGVFAGNCSATKGTKMIRPYAYSGIQALLPTKEEPPLAFQERPLDLVNLLRSEGYHNANRKKIVQWTKAYVESRSLANTSYYIGEAGNGWSASNWNKQFMTQMRQSKIVVTCNPAGWEGDFRLWEALLSGALVFVDKMAILDWMPFPLVNGTHFVVYDSRKRSNFDSLLDYYRSHPMESERIADAGYQHVVQHHMPRNRIEYILQNVQIEV